MPTLTFKVTPDEARRIRSEARGRKMTLSAYVRGRALNDIYAINQQDQRFAFHDESVDFFQFVIGKFFFRAGDQ